ncbi:GNAT family N-acetyltransferase [Rhodococcus sp. UFZ-B548]|uniref:GNAT family N-acetyltransferase n=1 Tax=Rhodococcus sp. UFZ-B548 TaxID=2742212 RepID=UPI0015F4B96D|nr:GNAT family N-acetyltransferase [Rhodococcus sp. UFZ-B548]
MTNRVRIPEVGPIIIGSGRLRLREPSPLDGLAWSRLRLADAERLAARIEGLVPVDDAARWAEQNRPDNWMTVHRTAMQRIELGLGWSWVVEVDNRFAGQMELTGLTQAPTRAVRVGAWIGHKFTGRGVGSAALALALDHAFSSEGVQLVEAFVDSDNEHSRRALLSMGFRHCQPQQKLRSTWESAFPPDPAAELFEITPADLQQGRSSFVDHTLNRHRNRASRFDGV